MNHFQRFQLPETFNLDKDALRRQFLRQSREAHPDFHAQSGSDEQEEALQQSAQLNEAYKILGDDDARLEYLLQLKGIIATDEKFNLPAGFLMEMMEVNENLQEANAANDLMEQERVLQTVAKEKESLKTTLLELLEKTGDETPSETQLQQLKMVYYQKKYLQRILDTGTNAANIAAR